MKILYFDTETTGLPKTREPASRGPNNWPHLVSIAWIIDDGTKREFYSVIKPQWEIPQDSIAIHKITQEYSEKNGSDLREVITKLLEEKPDVIVAHNMNFDYNVLVNAILWDLGMPMPLLPKLVCTMKIGEGICKIPVSYSKVKYKSPKLIELYEKIFNKKPEVELHNSLEDTRVLTQICEESPLIRYMIGLPDTKAVNVEHARTTKRYKTLDL